MLSITKTLHNLTERRLRRGQSTNTTRAPLGPTTTIVEEATCDGEASAGGKGGMGEGGKERER